MELSNAEKRNDPPSWCSSTFSNVHALDEVAQKSITPQPTGDSLPENEIVDQSFSSFSPLSSVIDKVVTIFIVICSSFKV